MFGARRGISLERDPHEFVVHGLLFRHRQRLVGQCIADKRTSRAWKMDAFPGAAGSALLYWHFANDVRRFLITAQA